MIAIGLVVLPSQDSAEVDAVAVRYEVARVSEVRHIANSYNAHNVTRLQVTYGFGRSVEADFLGFFDATGGLVRWGYPISEVFEEESGVLVQFFQNGVLEFRPSAGMQLRLTWDLLAGEDIFEPAITNENEGIQVGPWARTVSNYSVDGKETMFLEAFQSLGGVDSFGYPKTEARPDDDPAALMAVGDPPDGVVRQYFQAGVLEYYTYTTLDATIRPVGTELRNRRYPDGEWIGMTAFRQTAPLDQGSFYDPALLRHSERPVLATDDGVLVGRATHPYAIAYHSQQHLFYKEDDGWYTLYFDGENGVVAYSPDGRAFQQPQVVTHSRTGPGMSMYKIDGRVYVLYTDLKKMKVFLRVGAVDAGRLALGEPILVADMKYDFMAYMANLAIGPDGLPWVLIRSYVSTVSGSINHIWLTRAADDSLQGWTEPVRLTTDEEGLMTGFGSSGSLAFTGNDLVAVFVLISEIRAIVGDGNVPDELVTETLGSFKGTHDYIIISDGETAHLAYHTDNPAGQMMVYQNYTSGAGWSPIQEIGLSEIHATAMTVDSVGNVWVFYAYDDEIKYRVRLADDGTIGPEGCAVRLDPRIRAGNVWLASAQPTSNEVGFLWTNRIADRWEVRFATIKAEDAVTGLSCEAATG